MVQSSDWQLQQHNSPVTQSPIHPSHTHPAAPPFQMSRRAPRAAAPAAASSSQESKEKHAADVAMTDVNAASPSTSRGRKRKEQSVKHEDDDDNAADEDAAEERERQQSPTPASPRGKRAKTKGKAAAAKVKQEEDADMEDAAEDEPRVKQEDEPTNGGSGSGDEAAEEEEEDLEELAAAQGLSVYELSRQRNIRLKNEQLQMLNLAGMSSELGLRQKAPVIRAAKPKIKKEPAIGIRRSTRSSVADPNYVPPLPLYVPDMPTGTYDRARKEGVLSVNSPEALPSGFEDGLDEEEQNEYDTVLGTFKSALLLNADTRAKSSAASSAYQKPGIFSHGRFKMLGDPNGKKVVKDRATVIKVHPTISLTTNYTIVAAADKNGKVGIGRYENNVSQSVWPSTILVAQYAPHVNSVVDLHWSHLDSHVLFSASRDGSVRRLDIEAGEWQEAFVEDEKDGSSVSGLGLHPDHSALLVGDRRGLVHLVDSRASESKKKRGATRYEVGEKAINSCVISPLDHNLMMTGGLDRVVRAWDLRKVQANKPVKEWVHTQAINSVVFSDSGRQACSTSYDNTLKLFSCVNQAGEALSPDRWANPTILKHDNQTGRWVSRFRAVFAPHEVALAIGDMKRSIDILPLTAMGGGKATAPAAAAAAASSSSKKGKGDASSSSSSSSAPLAPPTSNSLLKLHDAEFVTTIPAAVAWHPTKVQVVGCTGSGRIYVYGQAESK